MRIHSDTLTYVAISDALKAEKAAGRIAASVGFKTITSHGSKTHAFAFEVQLDSYAKVDGDGRRAGNTGGYGGDTSGMYAATYDEWGWLLGALYALDPAMVCGTVKYPAYADRADFNWKTGLTYDPAALLSYLEYRGELATDDGYDPYPYVSKSQTAGRVGRRGAGRVHIDASTREVGYCNEAPRTAAAYRAFAKLETAAV